MSEAAASVPLSVELRRSADAVWEAQHRHPFVRGVGDGTLEPERFNVWVRQDYLYLTYAIGALTATIVITAFKPSGANGHTPAGR